MKTEKPAVRKDGTCSACRGYLCDWHQKEGAAAYNQQAAILSDLARRSKAARLREIAAKHEFESCQFAAWEEKAKLAQQGIISPRY